MSENEPLGEAEADAPDGEPVRRRRRGLIGRGLDVGWAFFHPPAAAWKVPGEDQVVARVRQAQTRLRRSRALSMVVGVGAVLVAVVMLLVVWALWSNGQSAADGDTGGSPGSAVSSSPSVSALPTGTESTAESAAADSGEPSGVVASSADLKRINEDKDLVRARGAEDDDALVTGARFARSLRTVDTRASTPGEWADARDSFLAQPVGTGQQDWGPAGDEKSVSVAAVAWARMDAAIGERGVAPDFPFGSEVEPGTHLVQVSMRLQRSVEAGGSRLDTPSGALMEVVVVCPPAGDVDRCVVSSWAEEPAGFVAETETRWDPLP